MEDDTTQLCRVVLMRGIQKYAPVNHRVFTTTRILHSLGINQNTFFAIEVRGKTSTRISIYTLDTYSGGTIL